MVLLQKPQRLLRAVHRQRMLFQEGGKPLHMVAVLVGDKDAVAVGGVQLHRLEGRASGPDALAHIHDEIPLPAAHHAAVVSVIVCAMPPPRTRGDAASTDVKQTERFCLLRFIMSTIAAPARRSEARSGAGESFSTPSNTAT